MIPLLLAFVTLLGFFLPAGINGAVLTTVGRYFPLVATGSLGHLSGHWWARTTAASTPTAQSTPSP